MACGVDEPPVARLLYAAVKGQERPDRVVAALLGPAVRDMREMGARELVFLGWSPWLARSLKRLRFEMRTRVITYSRRAGPPPATGNLDVCVRPALAADVDALVELDRVAFEPLWRYSANMHRRLVGSAAHCTIAEQNGIPIGYQTGDMSRDRGHIIRLAVHPDYQKQGVGTRLLADAIEFLRPVGSGAFW